MGRVVDQSELQSIRNRLRSEKKKVVFTNGVFDIIHRGHVEYLLKAKSLGDILIIGLNTDASVRRLKGEKRPLVTQNDRAFILANLLPVDFVCMFEEDTPLELISRIVPDVLVKGADYKIADIVGREVVEQSGGKVETIEFVPNRSTSGIIEQVLERFS
jgi:D-beta-D-heptose 7-phosphate kinase/D-beta-D-heptose 1-phosphate adenosyltransferase